MGRAAERGLETLTAFNEREPWVADQIGNRFIGIGHVFPGYTLSVIHDMEYGLWVMLALAYDAHVEETKKQKRKMGRPGRRRR